MTAPAPITPDAQEALLHDLRGALSGLLGGVSLLEQAATEEDRARQIARIRAAATLVEGLLGEMAGGSQPQPASADLEELLRTCTDEWTPAAEARGVDLSVSLDLTPCRLSLPDVSLRRIMSNLLGNALRHADARRIDLSARCHAPDMVDIVVTDDGRGLGDGLADARSGLGLSICEALVSGVGGRMRIESDARGTKVDLRLPASPTARDAGEGSSHEGAAKPAGKSDNRSNGLPDLGGCRILLAEDNRTNQIVAEQMLALLGAEVVLASDGEEALARFEEGPFDLGLIDIEMPRLSGLGVIQRIRARSDGRQDTLLVALTAYALDEHRERIAAAGANGIIPKPLTDVAAFGRTLASYLDGLAASGPATVSASAAIDRGVYDTLAETLGAEAMEDLLGKVVDDVRTIADGLARARDTADADQIQHHTHVLVSVAGIVGAMDLSSAAAKLNTRARSESVEEITPDLSLILSQIDSLLDFLSVERSDG
ncbi:hybrid sensor histidine kinase/response regulator [Oceanomicrobium pacificus]|uniref:histidine kinase n=1 Tax=Oceanomicrobium pacificus TaxID=2692916 RepID=A0A6B0TYK5_9RHOB|nr:response regulator [Oceanomicrobium pacificus]MXU66114.1 response regulator [Oceanomicrobium pacificus]